METRTVERHAAPLRQQVVRLLREDILGGVLTPGQRLLESTLCSTYGVSRTVIREALRQLESEYLITMVPNRGPIVTVLTAADIASLYQVRRVLEGLAGELFARHASDEQAAALRAHLARMEQVYVHGSLDSREQSKERFYELLLEGAGNPVLDASLQGVHARIALFRRIAFSDQGRVAHSMAELRAITREVAERRDPDAARQACEHHIQVAGELAILEYERLLEREQQTDDAGTAG